MKIADICHIPLRPLQYLFCLCFRLNRDNPINDVKYPTEYIPVGDGNRVVAIKISPEKRNLNTPPVFFLPGIWGDSWGNVGIYTEPIANQFGTDVYVLIRPGSTPNSGRCRTFSDVYESCAEALMHIVHRENIGECFIWGHSFGSTIAHYMKKTVKNKYKDSKLRMRMVYDAAPHLMTRLAVDITMYALFFFPRKAASLVISFMRKFVKYTIFYPIFWLLSHISGWGNMDIKPDADDLNIRHVHDGVIPNRYRTRKGCRTINAVPNDESAVLSYKRNEFNFLNGQSHNYPLDRSHVPGACVYPESVLHKVAELEKVPVCRQNDIKGDADLSENEPYSDTKESQPTPPDLTIEPVNVTSKQHYIECCA